MKQLIKQILKENYGGLSKLELTIFNNLTSKKENPYIDPFSVYNFLELLGLTEIESKELLTLYINNFRDNGDYENLKNIDRSNKLNDEFFPILFDNMFDTDDINWTHPYESFEDGTEGEDGNRMEFYSGNYGDDYPLFRWYGKDYWDKDDKHNRDLSPMIELEDLNLQNNLMKVFGESWKDPFMDWFKNNFNVEVKHISIYYVTI